MTSSLIEANRLIKTDADIWCLESNRQFEYTDGDAYEKFLKKIVLSTHDLSSQSPELVKKYAHWDWVSEYHLSSQRANLLRSLDMTGVDNALELGCGCGAITRYIGELDIRVDAIEGAPRRAEIARYRCRDLENVNIINANFNELTYPEETYDAVLLIGVIEYAKKFQPSSTDHRDAVLKILSFAASTVKPDGVIIIAIENRLGLKYWLGASEDHYGHPYTGLYGYPQHDDIRTYDRNEWREILDDMGTTAYRFAYPFPDYKMPRVVLFDDYIKRDALAYSSLYGLSSRDYLRLWQPEADEFLIWKSLHESGYLADFANSFLIVCSDTTQSLDRMTPNDFICFSNAARKPAFRTITRKPVDQDHVLKRNITDPLNEDEEAIKPSELKNPYIQGDLLSTIWLESIADTINTNAFEKLLKTYYAFVYDSFNDEGKSLETFDLLPFNIIVDEAGSYQVIDQEWTDLDDLSPEFIFFRALMWFSKINHRLLRPLCEQKDINNVKEFIEYGFDLFNLELGVRLDDFIEIEERMQARVIYQSGLNPIRRMIMEPFQHGTRTSQPASQPSGFIAKLYWEDQNREFNDNNSIVVSAPLGKRRQVLIFNLFYGFRALKRLQLNPVNRPGFFKMFYMALKWVPLNEDKPKVIWQLKNADEIAKNALMEGMHFTKTEKEALFLSTCDHPLMLFNLPPTPYGIDTLGGRFQFEVEMDWPKSEDMDVAERLLDKANAVKTLQIQELTTKLQNRDRIHAREIQNKDRILQNKDRFHAREIQNKDRMHAQEIQNKDRIHAREIQKQRQQHAKADAQVADFANQVHASQVQLTHAEASLNSILNSRLWKCLKPLRSMSTLFKRIVRTPSTDSPQSGRSFKVIEKSGLFDPPYYFKQNSELIQSGMNPIIHYIDIGARTGKNPNHFFDSQYYINNNPDVAESGINPFVHYLETGSVNGRSPHPLFDVGYYLNQNPDIIAPGTNPLAHYIEFGANTGINPHPLFDTAFYLEQNKDVADSGANPLAHYIGTGAMEGRSPHPLFDTDYYLNRNPDVIKAGINPLIHYITTGVAEGKNPHPLFDTAYYLGQDPDLLSSDINPLTHYLDADPLEKKNPHPLFDNRYYLSQHSEGDAFSGNPLRDYLETGSATGINPHPLFDTAYYLDQNKDVAESDVNPLVHYINIGAVQGRFPHPLFDAAYYLDQNPDVIKAGINPLIHYITTGVAEGKNPHPLFDTAYYLGQDPDLLSSDINPLTHYLDADPLERMNPNPLFDNRYYLSQHSEGDAFSGNPLLDYLETGSATGINPHPLFDTAYYLDRNKDITELGINPLAHYLDIGAIEGRSPHPLFDVAYYLNRNPDLIKADINPLIHYMTTGVVEGKNPHPLFDTAYYLENNPGVEESGIYPVIHYIEQGASRGKYPNRMVEAFQYKPKVSIIRAISENDEDIENILHHSICSVVHQIYGNWELRLLGDLSMGDHTKKLSERYAKKDPRIKIHLSEKPQGTADALNSGLSVADGEYILFLCDDDKLTVDALYENVKLINENNACDFIYSDEDKMDIRGNQVEGFLDMERQILSSYHVGHLALFRRSRLVEAGGLKGEHERFHDTDFLLRFLKGINPNRICYIPKQLYY